MKKNYRVFATVNTRSESKRARARIQTLKGSLRTSMAADSDKDEVFNESQLKKIKKEFSAGPHSGQKGWLEICDVFLKGKLELEDQALMDRGVEYVSPHEPSQANLFKDPLGWPPAIRICETTGASFSDSMILNALKASKFLFVVTLDFDIGYAALSDPNMKDVVVPDRLYREYKHYHFPTTTDY